MQKAIEEAFFKTDSVGGVVEVLRKDSRRDTAIRFLTA